tara:strand:- start:199 stop:339 length:141 start_codon:yes stop_codon:yes gene_type:complete
MRANQATINIERKKNLIKSFELFFFALKKSKRKLHKKLKKSKIKKK